MAVLTISRDLGSGGREVGRTLAANTGYRYLDHEEILTRVKSAGNKWEKWAQDFDEHSPRLWERYDWSYRGYVALMQSIILEEAVRDRVVVMGRGANYLLRDTPFALSIRVVAPFAAKVSRLADREAIDRDSARWLIEKIDRERAGFLYTVYGRNGKSPSDYDMAFDSGTTPIADIIEAVQKRIPEVDRLKDEQALNALQAKALAAKIKARLLTGLPFFMPTLEVNYDGENIMVRAVIRLRERERVVTEAKALAGGTPLKFELRYRQ